MWWLISILSLIALVIVAVHSMRGMAVLDRLKAAMDIVDSDKFEAADGFEESRLDEPDLVGWVQAGKDCVMLFRSEHGTQIKEVVDVSSDSFHPSLVLHFQDGHAVRSDEGELLDKRHQKSAEDLLRKVRQIMRRLHPQLLEHYDGFHY